MAIATNNNRLGQLLVGQGLIDSEQLAEALKLAGRRGLPRVLADLGFASEVDIAHAVADAMGLQYVDVAGADIDPRATSLLKSDMMRRYVVVPIVIEDDELVVAMADPTNVFALDDLRVVTGLRIRPVISTQTDLVNAIERFSTSEADVRDMVGDLEQALNVTQNRAEDDASEDSLVARLMNQIVTDAIRAGAGDIYIEPGEKDIRVRFRVDGVCRTVSALPKRLHRQLISRLKITCGMDIAEKRMPQDGRFGVTLDGKAIDFRVAVLPIVFGELAVMRLLRRDSIMMSLKDLGFLDYNLTAFTEALALPYGALLVTGPTGSGKSTTLYAAINETIDAESNLITVEDPVEYRLGGLSQVQVHEKAGLTFAAALRSILRQDPDKVMIGEIRDRETGTIAIEAALTGHLVLSTLHTNDAPSAITRLTEMGIEPFLTASAITLVMAQRLARRLCPDCREAFTPDPAVLKRVGFPTGSGLPATLYRAHGCKRCGGSGYRGRMGLHEVMRMSETLERLTVENATSDVIRRAAIDEGMLTLRDDGFSKVCEGLTSIEEVLRVVM